MTLNKTEGGVSLEFKENHFTASIGTMIMIFNYEDAFVLNDFGHCYLCSWKQSGYIAMTEEEIMYLHEHHGIQLSVESEKFVHHHLGKPRSPYDMKDLKKIGDD